MRRSVIIFILITLVAVTAASMAFMFRRPDAHWTTSSKQALSEFQLGMQDELKFYRADALSHYASALELDPEFVMARVKVAQLGEGMSREKWIALLDSIELDSLSERERALIGLRRARLERDLPAADRILDEYLARHPRDPHVLVVRCDVAWAAQDWQKARECYERVIQIDPNWMSAVNNLGYIAMAQGRMDEAFERFTTYRYIAPDHANSHDSMGELLTLTGRYDEARQQFLQALDLRPDYCASWAHLTLLEGVRGRTGQIVADLERAKRESGCEDSLRVGSCAAAISQAADAGEDPTPVLMRPECSDRVPGNLIVRAHFLAVRGGHRESWKTIEEAVAARGGAPPRVNFVLKHLEAVRALDDGRFDAARGGFEEIDTNLVWFGDGQGLFKVYNRAALVVALEGAGDRDKAVSITEATRKINAPLFDEALRTFRSL